MIKILYEITVCVLALISVAFTVIDLAGHMTKTLFILDGCIYSFFVLEYIIRLARAENKKEFVKTNILDLVAILPFSSALRIFRAFKVVKLARLTKLAKLTKITRLFVFSGRFLKKSKTFLNTNGFKYMLIISLILIIAGGALISYFEKMNFFDGIWWAFVTTTTVGYGDISPSTMIGRVVACVLMVCGIGLIGSLTSTITSFFLNSNDSQAISNDKIMMVEKLYQELNEEEKEEFKKIIE